MASPPQVALLFAWRPLLRLPCCVQVSISGQAVVFVVRTMSYSVIARAGLWTYIAFFLAQVGPILTLTIQVVGELHLQQRMIKSVKIKSVRNA